MDTENTSPETTETNETPKSEKPVEMKNMGLLFQCAHILHHRRGRKQHGQGKILQILSTKDSITQRELLDDAGTRSASLSELLGKMEASGFITRQQNTDDKRNVDIAITDAGREAAEALKQEREETARKLFDSLSEEENEQLNTILTKLLATWKQDVEISGDKDKEKCCSKHGHGGHGHHHGHHHGEGHGHHHGEGHGHGHGGHCGHHEHGHDHVREGKRHNHE